MNYLIGMMLLLLIVLSVLNYFIYKGKYHLLKLLVSMLVVGGYISVYYLLSLTPLQKILN